MQNFQFEVSTIKSSSVDSSLEVHWNKQEIPSPLPSLKNHTSILYESSMIIFGGYDGKNEQSLFITYDLITHTFEIHSTHLRPRNGHSATFVPPQSMFIIGGWLNIGPYASDEIFVYDFIAKRFEPFNLKHNESIGPTNMHTCNYYPKAHTLILFRGGNGIDFLNDLLFIDISTHKLSSPLTRGKRPSPRANHGSTIINDQYFIFGGWTGLDLLNDCYILNLTSLSWTEINSSIKPSKRAGMTFVNYLDENIIVFGGSTFNANYLNDIWVFDVETRNWIERDVSGDKPSERAGHSAVVYGNNVIIYGGGNNGNYLNDVYHLEIKPPPFMEKKVYDKMNEDIFGGIKNLFNNDFLSDLTIICQKENKMIKAHLLVLSFISETFVAKSKPNSNTNVIVNDKFKYSNFLYVISYCYGRNLTEKIPDNIDDKIEIFSISYEYGIEKIQQYFEKLLLNEISIKNFEKIYSIAIVSNSPLLKKYCNWFYRQNKLLLKGVKV